LLDKLPLDVAPLGDAAAVVRFGDTIDRDVHRKVRALSDYLTRHPLAHSSEHVPAYATVTIYYDVMRCTFREVRDELQRIVSRLVTRSDPEPRIVEIPVCYGGDFGQDLEFVARHNSLSVDDVVEIHSTADYLVYMIGFAPGFPYLGGMSERIAAPRRESPRLKIPTGSVGIAGMQTGVYPMETPGGWQLIGRTPLELFRPVEDPPALLRVGDTIRFRPITINEFDQLRKRPQ
jgi:inhibitor of KinA